MTMSYREVLMLVLLSQMVLVYTRTIVKRSPDRLGELDAFRGAVNAAMLPVVSSKVGDRESVKRDIQTQGMALMEFCFKKPYHPRCRQPQTQDYSVHVIQS